MNVGIEYDSDECVLRVSVPPERAADGIVVETSHLPETTGVTERQSTFTGAAELTRLSELSTEYEQLANDALAAFYDGLSVSRAAVMDAYPADGEPRLHATRATQREISFSARLPSSLVFDETGHLR